MHYFKEVGTQSRSRTVCDGCLKHIPPSQKPLKCSFCESIRYCSALCAKRMWPEHKLECRTLAASELSFAFPCLTYPRLLDDH